MSNQQEERGIGGQCSDCGRRVPRADMQNGKCPSCARIRNRRSTR